MKSREVIELMEPPMGAKRMQRMTVSAPLDRRDDERKRSNVDEATSNQMRSGRFMGLMPGLSRTSLPGHDGCRFR